MADVALCPYGSSVLRCHLAGLSRFSLLEFSSSVSRRHHSLLVIALFHFSFPTCFFLSFFAPPAVEFPGARLERTAGKEKEKKKVIAYEEDLGPERITYHARLIAAAWRSSAQLLVTPLFVESNSR